MNFHRVIAKVNNFATRLKHTRSQPLFEEFPVLKNVIDEFSVDCIFDIGADQGQYAQMLRNVGFKGTIVSVEPDPERFRVIRSKSKADARWHSENVVLASDGADQSLSMRAGYRVTSPVEPIVATLDVSDLNAAAKRMSVPVKNLEMFYLDAKSTSHFTRPFLKMDTQGHDAAITKSAGETIREFVGIQTDLSFVSLYSDSVPFHDSLDFYARLGFTLCAIVPNNAGHFPYLQDVILINTDFLENHLGAR